MPLAADPQTGLFYFQDRDGQWKPTRTRTDMNGIYAWDGSNWQRVAPPRRSAGETANDVARSIAQGATFGWADEIAAGLSPGSYEENLKAQQARNAEIPSELRMGGEALGGFAGGGVARLPAAVAARAPGWLANAAQGAAMGGLTGAGEAQPGQRLEGAVPGAATGAALGIGVPAVMEMARRFTQGIAPQSAATYELSRAFARDRITPGAAGAALTEMQQYRPGALISDVGGPNVISLYERLANAPGAARADVMGALERRQFGQLGRIANDLQSLTGTSRTALQAIDETMADRAARAQPLYDQAMNFNATQAPEIVRAWERETRQGYGKAFLNSEDFKLKLQTRYGIEDPKDAPLMVQIDAWKRVADDFWRDNRGTDRGNVVKDMTKRVLDTVDQYNPQYANARAFWSDRSSYLDAIEEGRDIINRSVSGEDVRARLARMTDAEREGYTIGAVSSFIKSMQANPAALPDLARGLRSPAMREKFAALMPDEASRQSWQQRLNYELGVSEQTRTAMGGSPTARRLAQEGERGQLVSDILQDVMRAQPIGLLRHIFGGSSPIRESLRRRTDEALSRILTEPVTGNDLNRLIQRMQATGPAAPSVLRNRAGGTGAAIGAFDSGE